MEKKLSEASNGKYMLSINSIRISLLKRSIVIKDLNIYPVNKQDGTNRKYILSISNATLEEFSFYSYLKNKKIDINKLNINDLEINIYKQSEHAQKVNDENDVVLNNFQMLIPEVQLSNFRFSVYRFDSTLVFKTGDSNIHIADLNLNMDDDSLNSLFFFKEMTSEINKIEFLSNDKMYSLFADRIISDSDSSSLFVERIRLSPNYSKDKFFKMAPDYISMATLVCPSLKLSRVNLKKLVENGVLESSYLAAENITADIFRDNSYSITSKVKPSAQEVIRDIPFPLSIDTVFIQQSTLNYEELAENEKTADKIFLNRINGVITGMNNDSASYTPDSKLKASISGYFMDKGLLKTNYVFNLNADKENFSCSGSLGSMPMSTLTPMFKNAKHLSIVNGTIDTANFNFIAGPGSAEGKMRLIYHDLKIESLPDKNKKNGTGVKLKTYIINNFIVIESNPGKDNKIRTADIFVEHDPYRYFPYYSRQALMSGLTNSIMGEKTVEFLKKVEKK